MENIRKKVFVSPFADENDLVNNVETAMVIVDKLKTDVKSGRILIVIL